MATVFLNGSIINTWLTMQDGVLYVKDPMTVKVMLTIGKAEHWVKTKTVTTSVFTAMKERRMKMIDKEKYESTGVCGYEECDDCGEKVCTHAYVDFYWGKMVFEMKCQNDFEWIETWTYKGSDWK